MKPIDPLDRVVRNISTAPFRRFESDGLAYQGASYLQIDDRRAPGTGLHVFRMEAGSSSPAHEHTCDEFFFVLEGELIDHDGARYGPGDLVLLRAGTRHSSHTPTGCTLLVYIDTIETPIDPA